jgi:hypothetical protein
MQTKLAVLAFAAGITLIGWQGARAVQARATIMDEASTAVLGVQQEGTATAAQSVTHRNVRIAQKGVGGRDARETVRNTYSGNNSGGTNKKHHQ